jgi:arylsulfatase A-like enzyme
VALDILARPGGDKHFLFLHLIDAHWPYDPPPEFRERFRASAPNVSHLLNKVLDHEPPDSPEEVDQIVALYDAEIAYADRELGRFFDELKARDLYDRSLIILFADHGEAFYEHGRWQHTITLYEEIIRIPLILKWPGNSPVGRVKVPVSQVSIFPTVLEAAGVDFGPMRATGLKQFVNESGTPIEPEAMVSECVTTWKPELGAIRKVSLRNDTTKYIATFRTTAESAITIGEILDEELYDLTRDPDEMRNLLEGSGVDTGPYQQQLRAYLSEAREFERGRMGEEVILDDAIEEQLKALGYVDPR